MEKVFTLRTVEDMFQIKEHINRLQPIWQILAATD